MIRMIFAFLVVSGIIHFGIEGWRYATGKQRWKVVKTLTYSAGLGIISIVILTMIVILF